MSIEHSPERQDAEGDRATNDLLGGDCPPLLGWPELKKRVGFSRATLSRQVKLGRFPAPIAIAANRRAWLRVEVEEWLRNRIAARGTISHVVKNAEFDDDESCHEC